MFCATCPHFHAPDTQCRRLSPATFLITSPAGVPSSIGAFPSTAASAWCGEHPERQKALVNQSIDQTIREIKGMS